MSNQTHFKRIAQDSLRMYFAPLTGAFKGIRQELKHVDRAIDRRREAEQRKESRRQAA